MSIDNSRMALKRHELFEELLSVMARELVELGVAPDAASVMASSVVDFLSTYWAGQVISFPKDAQYKLTLKELEIYGQHIGSSSYDELARQYRMTPRGMRKLINRIRAKIREQNKDAADAGQLDLLGH